VEPAINRIKGESLAIKNRSFFVFLTIKQPAPGYLPDEKFSKEAKTVVYSNGMLFCSLLCDGQHPERDANSNYAVLLRIPVYANSDRTSAFQNGKGTEACLPDGELFDSGCTPAKCCTSPLSGFQVIEQEN
ncbi:MAG: hypothetical protein LBD59_02680, partial [Prevotellaceae bacterium]|nr:hypothetical protein [Prevotellaceae bacterium]